MGKNYYIILGVEPDATPEQIRSAYRQKVKRLHPDHFGEDCTPFLAVQEAYNVLSDPDRRQSYDKRLVREQQTRSRPRPVTAKPVQFGHMPVEPLIPSKEVYTLRKTSFWPWFEESVDIFDAPPLTHSRAVQEIKVELRLTPFEAWRGGRTRLSLPVRSQCPACRGYGVIGPFECGCCYGAGRLKQRVPLIVSIPPGVSDDEMMSLSLDRVGLPEFYLTLHFVIIGV